MPAILRLLAHQVLIVTAVFSVITTTEVAPQTGRASGLLFDERFKTIELDENDPEVHEARRRKLEEPVFGRSTSRFSDSPSKREDRFLVDLDESQFSIIAQKYGVRVQTLVRQTVKSKQIKYDRPGDEATGFVVNYPSLDAQLRCYWAYDQELAKAISQFKARAREAELERGISELTSENRRHRPDVARTASPSGIRGVPSKMDPRLGELQRVRRQFKKGGRPCLLEVICFAKLGSEQSFPARIRSMQRKQSTCRARADAIVGALVIVRTGD